MQLRLASSTVTTVGQIKQKDGYSMIGIGRTDHRIETLEEGVTMAGGSRIDRGITT
jgi:hypothetical protein